MKMDEEDHKPRQALRKNNKKSEKALSQADFPKNPVISFSVLRASISNRKRYRFEKPRNHNGFWAFSYPDFQVQTKRYFSLLRGLELPTPRFLAAFERAITPEGRLFSFPLKIFSKRSSLKCMDDLTACSGKRFALHFGANLTKLNNTVIYGLTLQK